MATGRTPEELRLDGGHLALDFVNTVGGLRDEPPDPDDEALETYDDLIAWCRRTGLVDARDAKALERKRGGGGAVARAHDLRALVYSVFRAIADGQEPAPDALARLRDAEREALASARLVRAGDAMRWKWPPPGEAGALLAPIAHAAVDLLTSGPLDRIKVCGNCRWLFLDGSRNGRRRWCSMEECGTDVKHRRFVEQRRQRRRASA
jgi:predicted RNA-binding Zn ribbon-like protein